MPTHIYYGEEEMRKWSVAQLKEELKRRGVPAFAVLSKVRMLLVFNMDSVVSVEQVIQMANGVRSRSYSRHYLQQKRTRMNMLVHMVAVVLRCVVSAITTMSQVMGLAHCLVGIASTWNASTDGFTRL